MTPIKEVEFERTYDATLETMWQAWTDPEILKKWWGPNGVLIPECMVDPRVGGKVYIVMEATEAMGPYKGTKWPMEGIYTAVDTNSKLIYTAKAWTDGHQETTQIDQVTELTLASVNGKTNLKIKATINKIGPDAKMAVEGMQAGFAQQLDKLEKYLS
jgi:uncharacterized protein YndB with AHSA1/START domain